ncbi:MAG: hypothetical protein KY468_06770 [Armatimonadetes bacterium]|nr:hypothetical protein [Armatimonadota bacterium]
MTNRSLLDALRIMTGDEGLVIRNDQPLRGKTTTVDVKDAPIDHVLDQILIPHQIPWYRAEDGAYVINDPQRRYRPRASATALRPSGATPYPSLGALGSRKVTVHRDNVEAMDALGEMLQSADASYVIGGEPGRGRRVSVHFNDTPLEDALAAVSEAAGLRYHLRGNVIVFSSAMLNPYYSTLPATPSTGNYRISTTNPDSRIRFPGPHANGTVLFYESKLRESAGDEKRARLYLQNMTVQDLLGRLDPAPIALTAPDTWATLEFVGKEPQPVLKLEGPVRGRSLDVRGKPESVDQFIRAAGALDLKSSSPGAPRRPAGKTPTQRRSVR